MGNTYVVSVWKYFGDGLYQYEEVWRGEGLIKAVWNVYKFGKAWPCVKLEYRRKDK